MASPWREVGRQEEVWPERMAEEGQSAETEEEKLATGRNREEKRKAGQKEERPVVGRHF